MKIDEQTALKIPVIQYFQYLQNEFKIPGIKMFSDNMSFCILTTIVTTIKKVGGTKFQDFHL